MNVHDDYIEIKKPVSLFRKIWRMIIIVLSLILILIGIPLLVLPGPGLLFFLAAFLLLSTEYAWAKKFVEKFRKRKNDHIKQM